MKPGHISGRYIQSDSVSTEQVQCECQLGAYWRHLANTIEPSMRGSDVAFCQITLITC